MPTLTVQGFYLRTYVGSCYDAYVATVPGCLPGRVGTARGPYVHSRGDRSIGTCLPDSNSFVANIVIATHTGSRSLIEHVYCVLNLATKAQQSVVCTVGPFTVASSELNNVQYNVLLLQLLNSH
jgi:hypothetical protein